LSAARRIKLARSNTWDQEKKCDDQGRKHLEQETRVDDQRVATRQHPGNTPATTRPEGGSRTQKGGVLAKEAG